jgi:hypothetical protein
VSELREAVKNLSPDQLGTILVEVYRRLPKAVREEADLDSLIRNPPEPGAKRAPKKAPPPPNIEDLKWEVDEFVENAYAQNYLAPNRVISKSERPKWRFVVMRLYKQLQASWEDPESRREAAGLFFSLYKVLCHACEKVIFNTYDPFESVRIEQSDFFRMVLLAKQRVLSPAEFTEFAVGHATMDPLNRYTLHGSLIREALECFKTPDAKERALEEVQRRRKSAKARRPTPGPAGYGGADRQSDTSSLTEMAFALHVALRDPEAAVADFKANWGNRNPEIALYCLLRELFAAGQKDLLLREYDDALRKGVKPREEIHRMVGRIRESGKLPSHFGGP